MKYIIVDTGMCDEPIIFSESKDHSQMALDVFGPKRIIISAGFVSFSKEGLYCHGRSTSLNIESRPEEDSQIINRMIGVTDD